MSQKTNRLICIIKYIPIFNIAYKISNAYAFKGNAQNLISTAPLKMWRRRIGINLLFSIVTGIILSAIMVVTESPENTFDPEDAILGIFPDILGFGIGVFALLFAIPNQFLTALEEGIKDTQQAKQNDDEISTGAQMLPADMAYPLLVYCLIMLFAVFFRALPDIHITTYLSTIFLIYGFVVTLELLSSIYSTATFMLFIRNKEIHNKTDSNK